MRRVLYHAIAAVTVLLAGLAMGGAVIGLAGGACSSSSPPKLGDRNSGRGAATPLLSDLGGVPTTTSISAGAGLTGGGDLSTSRSLALDLAHVNSFSKDQGTTIVPLTVGSPAATHHFATDASTGNSFSLTLESGQADVLDNPTNLLAGHTYQWSITQPNGDAGVSTLTYGGYFKWPAGVAPTFTATLGGVDLISCLAKTTTRLECAYMGDVR